MWANAQRDGRPALTSLFYRFLLFIIALLWVARDAEPRKLVVALFCRTV